MDEVAGYRILRAAAHGTASRLLLGFDEGTTVVLKLRTAGDPRVRRELEALDRARGDHVVALLDVASGEDGTTLVLERLPGGTLAELLEARDGLQAGEAVTILAPLASTVERMHAAGVAHGALSPSSVAFRDDGAPVLVGFGSAEVFAAGAPEVVRETVPGVVADRVALHGLAALVLERVVGEGAAAAGRLAGRLRGDAGHLQRQRPAELADALYAMAAPRAVSVVDDAIAGFTPPIVEAARDATGEPEPPTPSLPPWLFALIPDGIRGRVEAHAELIRARWDDWPVRRRRLVLGGAAGTVTLLVALAGVPEPPREAVPAISASPIPTAATPVAGLPDDPVAAAELLLARREECLRELSVICLDAVVQAGSAAQARDVAAIRAVLAGGELPVWRVEDGEAALVERLGDSALLDLPAGSEPASLLLLKTAEGWRVRQYLSSEDAEPPAHEPG